MCTPANQNLPSYHTLFQEIDKKYPHDDRKNISDKERSMRECVMMLAELDPEGTASKLDALIPEYLHNKGAKFNCKTLNDHVKTVAIFALKNPSATASYIERFGEEGQFIVHDLLNPYLSIPLLQNGPSSSAFLDTIKYINALAAIKQESLQLGMAKFSILLQDTVCSDKNYHKKLVEFFENKEFLKSIEGFKDFGINLESLRLKLALCFIENHAWCMPEYIQNFALYNKENRINILNICIERHVKRVVEHIQNFELEDDEETLEHVAMRFIQEYPDLIKDTSYLSAIKSATFREKIASASKRVKSE